MNISKEERAYHEAGHLVVGYYSKMLFAEIKSFERETPKEEKLSGDLFSNPSLFCQFAIYLLSGYEAEKKYNQNKDFGSVFGDYLQAKNVIIHNLNSYGFDESISDKLSDQILIAYRISSKEIIELLWPVITKVANILLDIKKVPLLVVEKIIRTHGTEQIRKDFNNLFFKAVINYKKINLKFLEKHNLDIPIISFKTDFGKI